MTCEHLSYNEETGNMACGLYGDRCPRQVWDVEGREYVCRDPDNPETVILAKRQVRPSRRFDLLRPAREHGHTPWTNPKHNPFMGEGSPAAHHAKSRVPGVAPALDIPLDYFQRDTVPLMSRRVNGETPSYPTKSSDNPHWPASYMPGTKNAEAGRAAVNSLIKSIK